MTQERHERIGDLFDAALELPPSQRDEYLANACAGDTSLLDAVTRLLANHSDSGTFLEPLLERSAAPPAVIGPYRIVRQIGEGGMGTVYLARQTEPIRREVALKVIKPGMDSKSVIARFEGERQALALMSHPNIAQVFDAGTTDRGLPYFAMELVDGIPITQYCEANQLSLRERIEIFIPVCFAIQHAHQKGIIHRDIKPSNILVALVEGVPAAKVIDFGLAKALSADPSTTLQATHAGIVLGTLQYMSPEQAEIGAQDIDTRSDVYSLGAVLYELLSGTPPLDADRIARESYLSTLKLIRENQPLAPSAKSSRLLDRELDWIPLKALEKDRTLRYPTVNAMILDLRRYLAGEPIEAAPPSTAYRLTKFVSRHRWWIATVAAFAFVLMGGILATTWMAIRAKRAEQEALAVNEFLRRDILGQADPGRQSELGFTPDPQITVRTVIDRAAQKLDGRFPEQPKVEAALRDTIGSIYTSLGLLDRGQRHLRRAVELHRGLLGDGDEATIDSQEELAWNLLSSGDSSGAEATLAAALASSRAKLGDAHRLSLRVAGSLGWAQAATGKLRESAELLRAAESTAARKYGWTDADTVELQYVLFMTLFAKADYTEAQRVLDQARNTVREHFRDDLMKQLALRASAAMMSEQHGRFAEAQAGFAGVLAEHRKIYGLHHQTSLLSARNLAANLVRQGRFEEAGILFQQMHEHWNVVFPPTHPETLRFQLEWAGFHLAQNKLAEADAIYTGAQRTLQFTGDHPTMLAIDAGVAELRRRQQRLAVAETILARDVPVLQRKFGAANPHTVHALLALARVRTMQGRLADAEPLARAAVSASSPGSWQLFYARSLLGGSTGDEAELIAGADGLTQFRQFIPAMNRDIVAEAQQRLVKFRDQR